jgi:outer membrane protein assembly factor BamB
MKRDRRALVVLVLGIAAAANGLSGAAVDNWPQWRGPDRTGVLSLDQSPSMWPPELKKGWTVEVGEGYSSPIAGDGRVFLHARRNPDEVVIALDLASGKVVWEKNYPAPVEKNPYAKQMAKGPYSTPLLADGRLFTLGTTAILSAWNASDGTLVWRKDFSSLVDTSKLFCGSAMSPIRTKHGIIVHVGDDRGGTIAALDPATGKEVWTRSVQGPGYASPIEITLHGTPQIVTMTTRSVIGVAIASGQVLWEFPFDDEWNENIVTPVASGSAVIVSGVRQGTRLLSITRAGDTWAAKEAWHTPDVAMYMSSPVLVKGTLYAHSAKRKGQFLAMDPATGRIRWATEGRNAMSASVIAAGSHLLYLTTESQLVVSALDPDAFTEVRRYAVASSPTYAQPIVLRDRVLVRDASNVTVWTLHWGGGRRRSPRSGSIFRIVASRRSRSARLAQSDTAGDDHVASPAGRGAAAWDRGADAARRILPTLSGGIGVTQNAPQRSPPAAAPFRHQRSRRPAAQPMPAVVRIRLAAADNVRASREGTFCPARKREAGADGPRLPLRPRRLTYDVRRTRQMASDTAAFTRWLPVVLVSA